MDDFTKIQDCLIQHGKENDRVYIMKISNNADIEKLYDEINNLTDKNSYSKIFAKVPDKFCSFFMDKEFEVEAKVPNLFNGSEDGFFLSKFLSKDRKKYDKNEVEKVLSIAKSKKKVHPEIPEEFPVLKASFDDAGRLSEIYKEVFETYPFPIHDPSYIKKTMGENIVYFKCVDSENKILSISSSELYDYAKNVEMTDFATPKENRGKNLSLYLLGEMEKQIAKQGFKTSYTIARSASIGMNATFAKSGYLFSGTLVNNTNICGQFENMNVWYKPL